MKFTNPRKNDHHIINMYIFKDFNIFYYVLNFKY